MEQRRRRRDMDRTEARGRLALAAIAAALLIAAALFGVGMTLSGLQPRTSRDTRIAPGAASVSDSLVRVTVARVVDGDTLHVTMPDGTDETVRLIGVDTPESTTRHEPYGAEASAYAKRRLPKGLTVWIETDVRLRDRYGRMLAYVWLEPPTADPPTEIRSKMFNAQLLIDGYAQLLTIPPDVRYVDAFTPLESEARDTARGLWGLPAR